MITTAFDSAMRLEMPAGPAARVSDNFSDFAQVMKSAHGRGVSIQSMQSEADGATIRLAYDNAANMMEMSRLSDDIYLVASNFVPPSDTGVKSIGEDWIRFHFRIGGKSFSHFNGQTVGNDNAKSASLFFHPKNELACDWLLNTGTPLHFVALWCTRRVFSDLVGGEALGLPFACRQIASGVAPSFHYQATTMTSGMYRTVQEVLQAPPQTGLRRLYLQSKAYALLYEIASQVKTDMEPVKSGLSERDAARVMQAYEILIDHFVAPPGLDRLARLVGVNRTKLAEGFREMFGASIGELCNELRMDQAWHMLSSTERPIIDVALSLGYEHQANFSTAVKRRFGQTPREIRQASAG
ncbi:MAG: helix-turn-helix transcriptional regulator [Alphaproteobacteria bacterium]|nr:helix-turn-helix transcriptional regulator [Alphaproteobacteria bacterium]